MLTLLLFILLLAVGHCDDKPYMGLRGGGRSRGSTGGGDRGREGFRGRDGGETSPSVAGRAADPAGALLAEYQNEPWSAGGRGAHAHRALTTSVQITSVFKAVAFDGSENVYFGYSIATDGSITVMGAYNDNGGKGGQTFLSHLILFILLYKSCCHHPL
jgi:hypothetical protein